MRVHRHRSVRSWLALTASAAAAASGLAVLGSATAFAQPPPDQVVFAPGTTHSVDEGTGNVDAGQVAQFLDGGALTTCSPADYSADINWGDQTDHSAGTITCAMQAVGDLGTVALYTVTGSHTYKDSGEFSITVTVTEPDTTQTSNSDDPDKATISDANISSTGATMIRGGGEGGNFEGAAAGASAFFLDSNTSFVDANGTVDPGLTATINWGDGSTSAATRIFWPDCGECGNANVEVTGSHVYDANIPADKPYSVTITLTDDGGKSATSGAADTPAFADAALTADANQSLTATATKAFASVVGGFKDVAGAQAKASDFTATINWGDSSSSSGTLSQTASGAFSVSGSHTYASTGTKSITATVTDEEGQTVTLHATATVAAAPIVLPLTGQPTAPTAPWSMLALIGMALGVLAIAGGVGPILIRRARR